MSDQASNEAVGQQGSTAAAPETGAAGAGASTTQASETHAGAAQGQPEDPIAGLKSALGKERERASRLEKDWKKLQRDLRQRDMSASELQRELAELRARVNKPDPDAEAAAYYSSPPEYVGKQVSAVRQEMEQRLTAERIEVGKELMRDKHEDFDEAEAAFLDAAARDATLWNGIEPGRKMARQVYERGKKLLAGPGETPESRIAKLEAEIASLRGAGRDGGQPSTEAETATGTEKQKPSIPRSNVGTRGTGVGRTTTWAGPTPAENVWGRQRSAR